MGHGIRIKWQSNGMECPLEDLMGSPSGDRDNFEHFLCLFASL